MAKKDANARALKAAQGKSLAPRRYRPDTAGRKRVKDVAEIGQLKYVTNAKTRKQIFQNAAEWVSGSGATVFDAKGK